MSVKNVLVTKSGVAPKYSLTDLTRLQPERTLAVIKLKELMKD